MPPFQRFLEEQGPLVYRFLLAQVGAQAADDCFQETFLAALRAYPRLRDGSNLRAWALTIATRKALDAARAARRRPVPVPDVGSLGPTRGTGGGTPAAVELDPELAPDLSGPVWQAVRTLPPRQRAAVVHRVVLDRSYREVAQALGCSEQAARASVSEGVRRLRRELGASAGEEPGASPQGELGASPEAPRWNGRERR
ncbi:MAG TPA: sigma-70 family RNA polymerase sigma factor [Actinomycetota bacterium]|nr:sigma-70 family RNA polymerase sigma factor [Actinomycetota bacterium]